MKKIIFKDFGPFQRETFTAGFQAADDIGVSDWESATPWGCPWEWAESMTVPDKLWTPRQWGAEWFRQNRADILDTLSDELADIRYRLGAEATAADALRFRQYCYERGIDAHALALRAEDDHFNDVAACCFS